MPKRAGGRDLNQIAASIVDRTTKSPDVQKNPAAVALGRLGGLKGGKARAEKLSAARRAEIAKQAAAKRWAERLPEQ
jgi:hypothetical protein